MGYRGEVGTKNAVEKFGELGISVGETFGFEGIEYRLDKHHRQVMKLTDPLNHGGDVLNNGQHEELYDGLKAL
jgi:hypothetical protein